MSRLILLALIVGGGALHAQSPLVGTWKLTYPAGSRIENGESTLLMGTGTLSLEVVGDSLVGELVTDPLADVPARPPARLSGAAASKPAVLVSRMAGSLTINGAERPISAISTWTLEAQGDSLIGTVARKLEGLPFGAQGPEPVKGMRQRQ